MQRVHYYSELLIHAWPKNGHIQMYMKCRMCIDIIIRKSQSMSIHVYMLNQSK